MFHQKRLKPVRRQGDQGGQNGQAIPHQNKAPRPLLPAEGKGVPTPGRQTEQRKQQAEQGIAVFYVYAKTAVRLSATAVGSCTAF